MSLEDRASPPVECATMGTVVSLDAFLQWFHVLLDSHLKLSLFILLGNKTFKFQLLLCTHRVQLAFVTFVILGSSFTLRDSQSQESFCLSMWTIMLSVKRHNVTSSFLKCVSIWFFPLPCPTGRSLSGMWTGEGGHQVLCLLPLGRDLP
jgi:hypothetical protein